MGSRSESRRSWVELCSSEEFKGRWVALDAARYDETTERPTEGTVVDADDDLAELCGRLKNTGRKNCAVVYCEEPEERHERPSRLSRPRVLAQ